MLLISATGAQVAGDSFDGGEGTNNIVVANGTAAMAAEFDMDKIDDVLTIETTGAGDTSKNTTLTFSDIAETTAQTVVVDGTSLTAADLVVTNNADSTTTTFNITGGGVTTLSLVPTVPIPSRVVPVKTLSQVTEVLT